MDIEARVAVLEDHRQTVNGRLDEIVDGLRDLRKEIVALRIDFANQRGRLHWLWVVGAALLTACVTGVAAHYLP